MRGEIPTYLSASLTDARKSSVDLYRRALRLVPFLVVTYNLPFTVPECRRRIAKDFRRYESVNDSITIDRLVFAGRVELDEAALVFKQRSHVLSYFEDEKKFDNLVGSAPSQLPA